MSELTFVCPFRERNLTDELWLDPMRRPPERTCWRRREGGRGLSDTLELFAQLEREFV
jgi:hypothetical protein